MKLSIITINRNNAEGLRRTIESVASQTFKDFEYVVVDGASTDGSAEVVKGFEIKNKGVSNPLNFKWISEGDSGIYNAMNKGVRMACGEYTLMLNSADRLVDERVVERIIPELKGEDMIQGNIIVEADGRTLRNRSYGSSEISFLDVLDMRFLHQAIFIRRSVVEQYGYYDEDYRFTSDSWFFVKSLGFGNATFRYVDMDIANFDMHGISGSQSPKNRQIAEAEQKRWFGEHVSFRLMDLYDKAPKKIRLYDKLHGHRVVWYMVMVLIRIAEKIHPSQKVIRVEDVSSSIK